jgi:hypothetical protein
LSTLNKNDHEITHDQDFGEKDSIDAKPFGFGEKEMQLKADTT